MRMIVGIYSPERHILGGTDGSARLFRALGLSIVFHVVLLLCVVGLNNSLVTQDKPLIIDLRLSGPSILDTAAAPEAQRYESRAAAKQTVGSVRQRPMINEAAIEPPVSLPATDSRMTSLQQGEQSPGSDEGIINPNVSAQSGQGIEPRSTGSGIASESTLERGAVSLGGREQARYMKEHFAYIKELVQKQVSYPAVARNMGWQGRVVISFTIANDGTAKEVKVIESRGIEALNKSALEAVRKASPFPRPPAEAQIVLPVDFRLN